MTAESPLDQRKMRTTQNDVFYVPRQAFQVFFESDGAEVEQVALYILAPPPRKRAPFAPFHGAAVPRGDD
ncbi:MAG: hypothetical protein ACLUHK_02160 [Eubacteriales bacterium]